LSICSFGSNQGNFVVETRRAWQLYCNFVFQYVHLFTWHLDWLNLSVQKFVAFYFEIKQPKTSALQTQATKISDHRMDASSLNAVQLIPVPSSS